MKPGERLGEFVKEKGLRLTRERLSLVEGIKRQRGHFTVDSLVARLKKRGYKISRDTVYRNLSLLLDLGIVRRSFRAHRDTVYELTEGRGHHDHLLCRRCGRVAEFTDRGIEEAQTHIAEKMGFKLEHHYHQLMGVCSKCQR